MCLCVYNSAYIIIVRYKPTVIVLVLFKCTCTYKVVKLYIVVCEMQYRRKLVDIVVGITYYDGVLDSSHVLFPPPYKILYFN